MKQKDAKKFNAIVQYNNEDNSERVSETFYFGKDELKKSHL